MSEWKIFHGDDRSPHKGLETIAGDVPPWRDTTKNRDDRDEPHVTPESAVTMVNAALYLRRPLLVLGPPGCGKSSLAHAVAKELSMGRVLKWPINSRSKLKDGLYYYDAIDRLRDANRDPDNKASSDIGRYIRLGPLGTAFADSTPRVVLIDEIDKADVDLPNDLLHVLEDGYFEIEELMRVKDEQSDVTVKTRGLHNDTENYIVPKGIVRCQRFPFILFTSNDERELPPAFYRRCLRLEIQKANEDILKEIVLKHFGKTKWWNDNSKQEDRDKTLKALIQRFLSHQDQDSRVAYDQILNTMYVLLRGNKPTPRERAELMKQLMRELDK